MKLKLINQSSNNDFQQKSYKVKLNSERAKDISCNVEEKTDISFNVDDTVKHFEEDLIGKITFIGSSGISVLWNDNTRERFSMSNAKVQLVLTDEKTIETKAEKVKEEKVDIEKIKLQRKVEQLEHKKIQDITYDVKEKAAKELVDLAIMKNMIDQDDEFVETQKILSMNEKEFESYREEILNYDNSHEVTSNVEVDNTKTEAERMLDKVRGGSGIIGDFSKEIPTAKQLDGGEKRSLSSLKDEKFGFNNMYTPPSFEEEFSQILSNSISKEKSIVKEASNKIELPGFENLQGLTKPIQISKSASEYPTNTGFKELFGSLDWTLLSK